MPAPTMLLNKSRFFLRFFPLAFLFLVGIPTLASAKVGFYYSYADSLTTNFFVRQLPQGLSLTPHALLNRPSS
ncbi:hypothetical protein KKB28_02685, partial [bacterium]|nr:hypothetical protein [bacterium]